MTQEIITMKTGRTLVELAHEIERQTQVIRDFVADSRQIHFVAQKPNEGQLVLPTGSFELNEHSHRQLASWSGIPSRYYETLRQQAPELLTLNVNHWLQQQPARRLVRTLDNSARAFLSDRYLRLDHMDVLKVIVPILHDHAGSMVLLSSEVTERRLYMKVLYPDIEFEVKPDDIVRAGFMLSNSEIGDSSLSVTRFFFRDYCQNGCVFGVQNIGGFRRTHLGSRIESDDYEIYSDETLAAEIQTALLKMTDVIRAAADADQFERSVVQKLRAAAQDNAMNNPVSGVIELQKTLGFNEKERKQILQHIIAGADYSRWGALNAITSVANTTLSYDRATELEILGGKVLDLSPDQWQQISTADSA